MSIEVFLIDSYFLYKDNLRGVKLAIFDYISSIPSIKFPIKELIDMAR